MLELIGDYLNISSKEIIEQISAQYGKFANLTGAAQALIKIKQDRDEAFIELASRMTKFARLTF